MEDSERSCEKQERESDDNESATKCDFPAQLRRRIQSRVGASLQALIRHEERTDEESATGDFSRLGFLATCYNALCASPRLI